MRKHAARPVWRRRSGFIRISRRPGYFTASPDGLGRSNLDMQLSGTSLVRGVIPGIYGKFQGHNITTRSEDCES